jgi:hypothetical protein
MRATGTGNVIGLPPGEAVEVYCDGTNMDFVGLDRVGSYTSCSLDDASLDECLHDSSAGTASRHLPYQIRAIKVAFRSDPF